MRIKLLLFLLFCTTSVFAQIQNQKGKVILANGDTLSGSITYYYDRPHEVILLQERKEVLPTEKINEVILENGGKFSVKSYKTNEENITLLLQVLLDSPKISLFKGEEKTDQYYYVTKDGSLYRLENNEVIDQAASRTYKRKDNKYIGILSALMSDRIDLINKMGEVGLNKDDLMKLITEYNQDEITYNGQSNKEVASISNWAFFAQYSQFGSIYGNEAIRRSFGQMVGVQYFFASQSRHSLKISLDRAYYYLENENNRLLGVGLRYEFAVKKTNKYNAYMLMHLAEFSRLTTISERGGESRTDEWTFLPRMSPGIGVEVKPLPRVAIYGELNNIVYIDQLPKSFSLGLKYDFGKTSW